MVSFLSDEEILRIGAGGFHSITRAFVTELVATGGIRKPTILCALVPPDQFPCRMIEGGSEIMRSITDEQRKFGGDWRLESYGESRSVRVRIETEIKSIRVRLEETLERGLQISDVLLGPFNLRPRPRE